MKRYVVEEPEDVDRNNALKGIKKNPQFVIEMGYSEA